MYAEGQGAAEELLFRIRQELVLHQPGCIYMLYGLMTRLHFTLGTVRMLLQTVHRGQDGAGP